MWENNLTNFTEICRSPEVGPTPSYGLWPLVMEFSSPLCLRDFLDSACISPVISSHAKTISSLLLSCDQPKSHASKENHFWPRYETLLWRQSLSYFETSILETLDTLHGIHMLATIWNCSLLDFNEERVWVCGKSDDYIFVYQIY